jgi:integrase/recombinase XerD
MPPRKRKRTKALRPIGDVRVPDGFAVWVRRYLEWRQVRNYSPRTLSNNHSSLGQFVEWCEARGLAKPSQVTKPLLERYQRHLSFLPGRSSKGGGGGSMSYRSQHLRLVAVRGFFRWLVKQNALLSNPASDLDLPRLPERLPKAILTAREAERVLLQPDTSTAVGLRDRALLEVLYSTGMRRAEVIALCLGDIDAERGTVMIRQGKGRRDRMVPISERACEWVERYLRESRTELERAAVVEERVLFLTTLGEPLDADWLSQKTRAYVEAAELGKSGSCHLFRHTMATLMLENGADIRHIQEMLGHKHLETTQIYTQVSLRKLKAIHSATHPGSRTTDERDLEREEDVA